jgi:hypothetical protein
MTPDIKRFGSTLREASSNSSGIGKLTGKQVIANKHDSDGQDVTPCELNSAMCIRAQ